MQTSSRFQDGDDRFVWCVDVRGAVHAVSVLAFKDVEPDTLLRRWGWRYATEAEIAAHAAHAAHAGGSR